MKIQLPFMLLMSFISFMAMLAFSPLVLADAAVGVTASNSGYIARIFMGLAVVLAFIFALAWFVRRFGAGTLLHNQHMRIVSSLPLGVREKLVVVEAGNKQIMVGVTAQQITLLHTFEEPLADIKTSKEISEFGLKIREIIKKGVA